MAEPPAEVSGGTNGQIDRIDLTVDAEPAGRPEEFDSATGWRMPFTRTLAQGIHRVRAVATGLAGTAADSVIFAIGTLPFTIGFLPERLVLDRTVVRDEPVPALLGILGPPYGSQYEVSLTLEDAGGLTFDVFPFTAFESTLGLSPDETEPVKTSQPVFVDLTIDARTALGEHRLTVRADGPAGTEPQRATLTVEVIDGTAPPTPEGAPASQSTNATHRERYRVDSTGTSIIDTVQATWVLAFACPDGRCDAGVRNGGPRAEFPEFTARYVPEDEGYAFDFVEELEGACSERKVTGRIAVDRRGSRGPVRFRYRAQARWTCDDPLDASVWEGSGRRR